MTKQILRLVEIRLEYLDLGDFRRMTMVNTPDTPMTKLSQFLTIDAV